MPRRLSETSLGKCLSDGGTRYRVAPCLLTVHFRPEHLAGKNATLPRKFRFGSRVFVSSAESASWSVRMCHSEQGLRFRDSERGACDLQITRSAPAGVEGSDPRDTQCQCWPGRRSWGLRPAATGRRSQASATFNREGRSPSNAAVGRYPGFLEAEAYDGPALIIAYSHCVARKATPAEAKLLFQKVQKNVNTRWQLAKKDSTPKKTQ